MRLSSKTVSINGILEGKNVWRNLKIEQKVSVKLLIEFEISLIIQYKTVGIKGLWFMNPTNLRDKFVGYKPKICEASIFLESFFFFFELW